MATSMFFGGEDYGRERDAAAVAPSTAFWRTVMEGGVIATLEGQYLSDGEGVAFMYDRDIYLGR